MGRLQASARSVESIEAGRIVKLGIAVSAAGVVAATLMAVALAQQFSIPLATILALVVTALATVGFVFLWVHPAVSMAKTLEREAPGGLVLIVRPALDFDAGLRRLGKLGKGEEWGRGAFALVVAKPGVLELHKAGARGPLVLASGVVESVKPRTLGEGAQATDLRLVIDGGEASVPLNLVVCNQRFPAVDVQDERALNEIARALLKALGKTP